MHTIFHISQFHKLCFHPLVIGVSKYHANLSISFVLHFEKHVKCSTEVMFPVAPDVKLASDSSQLYCSSRHHGISKRGWKIRLENVKCILSRTHSAKFESKSPLASSHLFLRCGHVGVTRIYLSFSFTCIRIRSTQYPGIRPSQTVGEKVSKKS